MKKLLFILLCPLFLKAQDVPLGQWKDYLSYNSASYICGGNGVIFCVANGSLFFVQKEDNTINRISKITGLSDIQINKVAHSSALDISIIIYENCNIDILANSQIINISDVKRKEIIGNKEISNITIKNNIAYLSSSFGLVLVDLINYEIKDTYQVGDENGMYRINGCAFLGDSIITATSGGIFYANINSPSLSDYTSWSVLPGYSNKETYDNIVAINDSISGDFSHEITSISYNNNTLLKTKFNEIAIRKNDGSYVELNHSKLQNIKYAFIDEENNIWAADSINGLLKFKNYQYEESYNPEGPVRNDIYSLEYEENKLYQCHGGHVNFGENALINDGVSIKDTYDNWINYDRNALGNARDVLEVAVRNGVEYYASWYHGISEIKDGELIIKHGFANTNGALDTCWYSNNRIRISDMKFDSKGNLWALSSEVNHPIVMRTQNNDWYSYSINRSQVDLFFDDLLIDRNNQKWGVLARNNGLVVFTENNTPANPNDDLYKIINTNIGSGKLPSLQTYSLAEDLDGEVWVGTDQGIGIFYNPAEIFSGNNFDAQQVLITDGDYGQYLLGEEKIKCIVIDGANRKWIGTEKSGVFLISENGEGEILHFTKNNSPLFSNNIIDIAINHKNGEVFIGTDKGLLSYRSDATKGVETQREVSVFPSPVDKNYTGPIAIRGLTTNANVKITDMSGGLVFETSANGGQAIWPGKNKNGERAATGVYLVFSTDSFGAEKIVSKILFIH